MVLSKSDVNNKAKIRRNNAYFSEISLLEKVKDDSPEILDEGIEDLILFTTAQDMFLIMHICCIPTMKWTDLHKNYNREFSTSRKMTNLQSRFDELLMEPLQKLSRMYLDDIIQTGDGKRIIHPKFAYLVEDSETWPELVSSGSYESLSNDIEDVHLMVEGRNFATYTKIVSKALLRSCSKNIDSLITDVDSKNLLTRIRHNPIVYAPAEGMRPAKIRISDRGPLYDNINVYDHFDQPIIDKYLTFSRDPKVVTKMTTLKRIYDELRYRFDNMTTSIKAIMKEQKEVNLQQLELQQKMEISKVEKVLEQTLENEIRAMRNLHEITLRNEKNKIQAKYWSKIQKVADFFDREGDEVVKIHDRSDKAALQRLQRELAQSSLSVDNIFGRSDHVLRLLLLAEDFQSSELRSACVRYFSIPETFPQFATRPELSCPIILDTTIMSLLQRISDKDLVDVISFGNTFPYIKIANRELTSRQVRLANELKMLSNDVFRRAIKCAFCSSGSAVTLKSRANYPVEIQALADKLLSFAEVRQAELLRRREAGEVVINEKVLPKHLFVTPDCLAVQVEAPHRYLTAVATVPRSSTQFGKWMFEVTVEALDTSGGSISIGWEVDRNISGSRAENHFGEPIPGVTPCKNSGEFGILWQTDGQHHDGQLGILHSGGASQAGYKSFSTGDVIGCTIDQDSTIPCIQFYKNGIQIIPRMLSQSANDTASIGIPIQSRNYQLFPAVCMYTATKGATTRVRFNFRGNFDFPILSFEAYGADMSDLAFNDPGNTHSPITNL